MRRKRDQRRRRTLIALLPLLVLAALQAVGADVAAGEAAADALQAALTGGALLWRLLGVAGLGASVLILRRAAE